MGAVQPIPFWQDWSLVVDEERMKASQGLG